MVGKKVCTSLLVQELLCCGLACPAYHFTTSLFKFPVAVANKIKKLMRDFLWEFTMLLQIKVKIPLAGITSGYQCTH